MKPMMRLGDWFARVRPTLKAPACSGTVIMSCPPDAVYGRQSAVSGTPQLNSVPGNKITRPLRRNCAQLAGDWLEGQPGHSNLADCVYLNSHHPAGTQVAENSQQFVEELER